jgi:cytochrome c553
MTRLVTFLGVLVALVLVLTLLQYKSLPVDNQKFDFEEKQANYKAMLQEREELALLRERVLNPPEPMDGETEVEQVPLVELTTTELQNGHDLYQRCIVCHGKYGEGKASQDAPALAGQHYWYVASSLKDMKSGKRVNVIMNPYLKPLSESDMDDIATYLSKLPWIGESAN